MFSSQNSQVSSDANYIEDVFSTYLYTGTGASQTITNGIDLSGKGGLVWLKSRNQAYDHTLIDTVRGSNKVLYSNATVAEATNANVISAFSSTGFTTPGTSTYSGESGTTYASWTFREQPKFFDVVTYTGTGSARTIAHNLGSVPGCIIVKRTDSANDWWVYHRSLGNEKAIYLDLTNAAAFDSAWNNTDPTSTVFSVGSSSNVNASGGSFVAYLFAHNAGGFGLTGTDNVISCGSFTTDASGNATVNLGYEPQWVMIKRTQDTGLGGNWYIQDSARLWAVRPAGGTYYLSAESSSAEAYGSAVLTYPTSTGFVFNQNAAVFNSKNFIYIAIRRGPMKVPTSGTSVFAPVFATDNAPWFKTSFPPDMGLVLVTNGTKWFSDRLRGQVLSEPYTTTAEVSNSGQKFDYQNGWHSNTSASSAYRSLSFRRAPSFFDEVCYTGTGSARTVAHNLAAVPELMIVKSRSVTGSNWLVYNSTIGPTNSLYLNLTTASDPNSFVNNTAPTSSVFSLGTSSYANGSGSTYVAYLFATCAGVSKVGSYTGTGTTLQVNCGFTGGARFVLIKRTDSTGDWYVWDTARGIVAGNDPYLLLNSTAAEVTNTDYVDTYSAGFEISSTAPAAINASGGTFIFLAIA